MNKSTFELIAISIVLVVMLGAVCAWTVFQWFECRGAGMGVLY